MKNAIKLLGIIVFVAIIALAFITCEGPEGPMGPQGEQGQQGPQGLPGDVDPDCQHFWWTDWVETTARTCIANNEESRRCIACPHTEKRAGGASPLGHDNTFVITLQPTETTDGTLTESCSRTGCGVTLDLSVSVPAWNKFYGNWGVGTITGIINANEFKLDHTDGRHTYFSITGWEAQFNTHTNNDVYISGYKLVGSTTSNQGWVEPTQFTVFLSLDGQSLAYGRNTDNPNNILTK